MAEKFLLVSQVFYPDQVSTANLFTILSSILAEDNVEVEVWSAHPSYMEIKRQPSFVEYNGIKIYYLPSTNFRKTNLAGRFCNTLTFTVSVSVKVLFSKEKTTIWTHSTPPFLGIVLSFICPVKKRKFIYILHDIFPAGLIRLGKVSAKNPLIRFWHFLFIRSLNKSHRIITNGRDLNKWVIENCKLSADKVSYIPNFQNDAIIFPQEFKNNKFIIEQKLTNKFIVQYSGNMGLWNEMRTIGKAVKSKPENVIFIFVGGGMRKEELLDEISDENAGNIILLPFQAVEDFNNILNASHVHLVTLKDKLDGIAVPCKIYGILAAARPVIAMVPQNSEIAFLVKEENCGIVLDPTDIEGLLNSIELLKNDDSLRIKYGQNGRAAFEKKYSARIIAKRYSDLLSELSE
jgi:glycosyltransferase involved in cell wall biosynthesis